MTLGTGLGSAFLVDGTIVREGAGVPPNGELYRLQFRGAPVEDAISGRGLLRRFGADLTPERIAELAREGDPRATDAFTSLGADLAEFLAPPVREFQPDRVVVGGAIARAWPLFGNGLANSLAAEVVRAGRLDDAPLLGAALHAGEGL